MVVDVSESLLAIEVVSRTMPVLVPDVVGLDVLASLSVFEDIVAGLVSD